MSWENTPLSVLANGIMIVLHMIIRLAQQKKNVTYYIRIQGYAIEGDVDRGDAVIKLMTPLLGKHYYPHGIEYGEEEFSENLIERANKLITKAKEELIQYKK